MSQHQDHGQAGRPNRHTGGQQTPPRVANRMEGKVKNVGSKKVKK